MTSRFSVALDGAVHDALCAHLIRADGQEDICFALWRPSTGRTRLSALIVEPLLPLDGERFIHGNASFTADYALRAARAARAAGAGIALLHSHPGARAWQSSLDGSADAEAERKIANLAREITDVPLVGLTLGTAARTWSARVWDTGRGPNVAQSPAETVRVIGPTLHASFNPQLRPAPSPQPTQVRTVHSWGDEVQTHLARLRVLVAGGGSVGQLVAEMLARTGVEHIGVMDFDTIERVNLDRLHGATRLDARLLVSKSELAERTATAAATASPFTIDASELSICEPDGMSAALDYDVIFSCVDRPWPRHVLNTIANADLIPIIDGGVRLEPLPGGGLRNAYWRSHIAGAGRTCIRCVGQYNPADVQLERDGSLDDPTYIAALPPDSPLRTRQNVYATSLACASALTNQFLSLIVSPSGFGDPGPRRYDLRQHRIEEVDAVCQPGCTYLAQAGLGDGRTDPTGIHHHARKVIAARREGQARFGLRVLRRLRAWARQAEEHLGRHER